MADWNSIVDVFGVFAKFWEAGKVKTRLAKSVGDEMAAEVYFQFLKSTLKLGQQITLGKSNSDCKKVIGYSPIERLEEFVDLAPDWKLIPQVERHLGARMRCFFESCLADATKGEDCRVVLIGSDTPALQVDYVTDAFNLLHHYDVVLGPSFDGGYYLIGCRHSTPDIFENIDWSTPQVLEQTVEQLNRRGYQYAMLEKHNDIDELDDLRKLQTKLRQNRNILPPHQIELLDFLSQLDLADGT